MFFWL